MPKQIKEEEKMEQGDMNRCFKCGVEIKPPRGLLCDDCLIEQLNLREQEAMRNMSDMAFNTSFKGEQSINE